MNNIPNVNDIVKSWSVPMNAQVIKKKVENRIVKETKTNINFKGVPVQPLRPQELQLKPEGQRNWRYFTLFCDYKFDVDDVIIIESVKYRITGKNDWNISGQYGFCKYELLEDYERD
jgi:hypothetical protein